VIDFTIGGFNLNGYFSKTKLLNNIHNYIFKNHFNFHCFSILKLKKIISNLFPGLAFIIPNLI